MGSVAVNIKTDNYPAETSWTIQDNCGAGLVGSGSGYSAANADVSELLCLPDSEYTFTISDQYGDGICCGYGQGSYSLTVDGSLVKSGGEFTSSDDYTFGSCSGGPPVTQNPTSQPTALPTKNPTPQPTDQPVTLNPTKMPTLQPTGQPSRNPTNDPTSQPSNDPTSQPSNPLTNEPTSEPSSSPSKTPSANPTLVSTNGPTNNPTSEPTPAIPLTATPTSVQPTYLPTDNPTVTPEATTLRTLVCGMNNKCSANEQTAEKNTVQAVRCCRDESHGGSGGWPFKCRSDSQ